MMNMNIQLTQKPLMITIDDQYNIVYVSWGPPPREVTKHFFTIVSGALAHQLYIALAGHAYGEPPETASVKRSLEARRKITSMGLAGARTPRLALIRWGHKIQPWLGVTKIDPAGQVIMDDPDYHKVIEFNPPPSSSKEIRLVTV